jgi:predicted RNase H-related nuclease YkuK (DUF458 family)
MPMDDFKRFRDGGPVDPIALMHELRREVPLLEIAVGSDSQNRDGFTVYSTTVVIRFPGNGARVVYRRERTSRVNDLWTRLWGEVERSVAVARWLEDAGGIRVDRIDMDLNSAPQHASHRLFHAAVGFVKAHGYEARTKPDLCPAAWAADVLCHSTPRMHETPIRDADRGNVTLRIDL